MLKKALLNNEIMFLVGFLSNCLSLTVQQKQLVYS
jgi:hypothetical protein